MLGQKSDTPGKNASSTKNSDTELNKSKRCLVKGPKPLQKLKFYLDIKNHAVTSKLEDKIKELGGAVEFFLDREVTHVISDRPQCSENSIIAASSPLTPRIRSVDSVYANESPISVCESPITGRLRQKTRADAMLEKVRSQSTNKVTNPLQNAKLWGIPIWTVNKVLSWLERVSASITITTTAQKTRKSVKVISIASPFVKFEPIARNGRPVYKTIQSWPIIDLESNPGKPAFIIKSNDLPAQQKSLKTDTKQIGKDQVDPESTNETRMTRKQRTRLSVRGAGKDQEVDKQALIGGFCEICHCEYREIGEHVRSEQHLNFIKNDANFLELDSLISAGANVEAFLRLNGNSGKDLNNYPLFCRRSLRKVNGKSSPEKCNGSLDDYSPPVTRNRMPRTRNNSSQSPLSPTGSDSTVHHLRSRGQLWLPNNLIGTTAEDEPFVNKMKDKERGKNGSRLTDDEAKGTKENESEKKTSEVGRPKRTCPKTKRISADERLVADNKTYYKVEVMTTKLRSSGLGTRETEVTRRTQTPIPEEPESEEQGLVVKFKRVRRSELSVLNDEAENFMFPRKDDGSSLSDIDTDDAPNTTKSTVRTESSDIRSSELEMKAQTVKIKQELVTDTLDDSSVTSYETEVLTRRKRKRNDTAKSDQHTDGEEQIDAIDNFVSEIGLRRKTRRVYTEIDEQMDESSKDGSTVCESESGGRRKRRRTHAEVFITDNQRYYKFETPGSRLRYQGLFFSNTVPDSDTPNKNNGESSEQKEEVQPDEDRPRMPKDDLKFSFELLPKSEPWYQTFKRQDSGEIIYTCTSDPDFCTRFALPYQLPLLFPLDPKECIEEYLRKKRAYLNPLEAVASTSEEAALGDTASHATDDQPVCESSAAADVSADPSTTETEKQNQREKPTGAPKVGRRRKRKSRFLKLNSMHPRKSPRQHASTLAILSSLINQRKKRERKSHGESDTSRASLTSIPEEETLNVSTISEEEKQLQEQQSAQLSKAIDEILSAPMDDLSDLEPLGMEGIEIKQKPDAIELIQNFDMMESHAIVPVRRKPGCVRGVRRKRKKNRTGWPKKKRLFVKRCGQKSEDGNGSLPELEDSRLTEISMEDENGELEMCELEAEQDVQVTTAATGPEVVSENNSEHLARTTSQIETNVKNKWISDVNNDESGVLNNQQEIVGLGDIVKEETEILIKEETNIQGVFNCTEWINNVKIGQDRLTSSNNSLLEVSSKKINSVLAENINNNSVCNVNNIKEECVPVSETPLSEKNDKNNGVTVVNNLLVSKISTKQDNITTSEVPETDATGVKQKTPVSDSSTMIKVSVSTDFSPAKVPATKKSDTVYSVTILDCKKSVADSKKMDIPCKKNQRAVSTDCAGPEEVIVATECVNVTLDKWENAEKVLHAKMHDNETEKLLQYQPFVRVQKMDNSTVALQNANRRLRSSSSPERKPKAKRARIVPPTSPRSPRKLRAPRGKWYRER